MSRVAWCTGAGKGIGRAVAALLAKQGWVVAASSRTAADLEGLRHEIGENAGRVVPFPLDVTDEKTVSETVDSIEKQLGDIDLVILNAGNHIPVTAADFTAKPFRDLFDTNVMGVVHGLAAILPKFIHRRKGHIAVVSSVAGYRGLPSGAAYGATKAALINMCEALKPELDASNVKITLINPGFVKTPLTDKNEFAMPFLMDVNAAAERIVRGLENGRFEITFPRRFTWMLKALRILPYPLYFAATRKLVKN